ncbi:santa-maria [Drosophila busckii]|uniref:Santa-maria n=1 Tax=Drosophila busckii TaxID=30019 RepID=A0A0M4E9F4_DROBS|nr:protein peste [Drosophila busckii]ALC38826.1 santa-maria [Drosophila busckii]
MPAQKKSIWRTGCNRGYITCISGFLLTVLGIYCGMFWEDIFNWIKHKEMALAPETRAYYNWKTPPIDLHLDIYLYNWTNPEEFYGNSSSKPVLEQLGPYRFVDRPDKVNISWHPDNNTVTYKRRNFYYFDAAGSAGSLDDVIVTLNAVALSAAATAKQWNSMRRSMVDVGLKLYGQQMSVVKTVDEILFTGYSDAMIDMAIAMPSGMFGDEINVPFDKFGWFYTRNGSADLTGVFNVFTGADEISKLGQMHSWNYKTHTGFFESDCGLVGGSAGEFQPPQAQPGGSVSLFTADLCRSLPLDYVETVQIEGLKGYKFAGGPRSVDNGTLFPENLCYCGGECSPSGIMNISACRFDSPVFMSYPHFYQADQFYVDQVEGLQPDQQAHEFYMIVAPDTGIPLEVAARFQVNMLVEPIDGISLYTDIPRIFFPLIWFEQKVRITPELADQLKLLPMVLLGGHIFAGFCLAIGLILLCWLPMKLLLSLCRSREYDVKMQHKTNGQYKSRDDSSSEKLPADSEKIAPDSSPLLDEAQRKLPVLINSPTKDSGISMQLKETP